MIEVANRKRREMASILTENDRPRQIILHVPPITCRKNFVHRRPPRV
jgi:hypothetical protein